MHELCWEVSCIRKLGTIVEACKGAMHQRLPNGKSLIAFYVYIASFSISLLLSELWGPCHLNFQFLSDNHAPLVK